MKPRVLAAFACLAMIVCICASPSYAGLFNRTAVCPAPAIAAPAVMPIAAAEVNTALPAPEAAAERRCILPWNCPNGRCPHDEVNVSVVAPTPPLKIEGVPPVNVTVEPTPATPFPYGILLAALLPVVIVASVIAFMVRVGTSRG